VWCTSASDFSPLPFTDFVSVLRYHAITKAQQTAYIFLADGETESARLTFAQLDQRARAIAVQLQALNLQGQTALLLYPPSLDYIAAFLGCLYAGVIAVPAYPPSRHHVQRLTAIIEDAKSAIILSHTELAEKLQSTADHTWTQQLPWLLTNETNMALAQQWQSPAICADSLAFLQYTSGSTGDPKGVMISHGNLLSNQRTIQKNFQHQNTTKVVGWLPFYHDMGLIGNILQPLYLGGCAILMPPLAFLEKPVRWLRAISHYRADTSGGPNFAYDLCVNKITAEQKAGLDLSSWSLAFNGAETVRGQTLARFSRAFAECGFRSQSFHPCYGLAEATLFVAGVVKNQPTLLIDDAVSCGQAGIGSQICIVNPQTQTLCAEGQEGEIWCAGSSIAKGYWRKPELSVQIFQAQIIDNKQYFLRTGDLGKREQGQLIITGRLKELIIIRGRNYYPQDIEFTLTAQIPELIAGACVAFSSFKDAEEQLVIVAEITRHAIRQQQFTAILQAIRQHLTQQCELSASEIILVAPGVIPKTSSGKLRRLACKDLYQQKQLPSLVQKQPFTQAVAAMNQADSTLLLLRDTLQNLPIQHATPLLSRFLLHKVAQLIKVDVATLATDLSLVAMGLDSLKIVELKHNLDSLTGKDVPLSLLLSDDSVAVIAESILTNSHAEIISPVAQVNDAGLSHTQQAMWTVQQLHPSSVVYNLHLALHIQGDIKVDCLQQVIAHLLLKHLILRSVYQVNHDLVQQTLLSAESSISCFEQIAADQWSLAMLQHDMSQRVQQPFNLATELPLRITLYQRSQSRYTLLFCVHHIAVDLWSILHLLEELKNHYLAVLN
jgi:acyl-CoA synthetase (AMP-forming)/AMP-acid ligase II/aryl carrier-like protein